MGRKKNLDALKGRREYLKRKVEGKLGPDTFMDVFEDELDALEWAIRKIEAQEISVGDRVRLYVYDDPEGVEGHQPEQGEVIGYASGGFLVRPFTGEYSGTKNGLWYAADQVWLVDP